MRSTDIPPHIEKLYDELNAHVEAYFKAWWAENNVDYDGDYIASWAIIANYGNLDHPSPSGYTVETFPSAMAPHAMKGLFGEAIDWVVEQQASDDQ